MELSYWTKTYRSHSSIVDLSRCCLRGFLAQRSWLWAYPHVDDWIGLFDSSSKTFAWRLYWFDSPSQIWPKVLQKWVKIIFVVLTVYKRLQLFCLFDLIFYQWIDLIFLGNLLTRRVCSHVFLRGVVRLQMRNERHQVAIGIVRIEFSIAAVLIWSK